MIAFAYRRRQAEEGDTNTRLFGLFGGNNGCNCGRRRRRRQAPGEGEPGVRFFGLENLLGGGGSNNCGCNCGYNQYPQNNYPSNNYPSNNYPSNSGNTYVMIVCSTVEHIWNQLHVHHNVQLDVGISGQNSCQCNYQLTFQDKYGNTHGACRFSFQYLFQNYLYNT